MTDTIPLGNGPGPIAAGEAAIWVANSRDGTVARIDPATRSVKAEIPVGRLPSGIAVGAGAVWVANSLSGTVSRIDPRTNRVTKTIDAREARRIRSTVAGGRLWVSVEAAPPRPAPAGGRRWCACCSSEDPGTTRSGGARRPAAAARDLRAADDLREPQRLRRGGTGARARHGTARGVGATGASTRSASAPDTASRRPPAGRSPRPPSSVRSSGRWTGARTPRRSVPRDIVGAAAYRDGRARTVAGVSARGDRLTIRLTRPSPTLPARMASFPFCAVPAGHADPATRARARRDGGALLRRRGRAAASAWCCAATPAIPVRARGASRRSRSRSARPRPAPWPTSRPGARTMSRRAARRPGAADRALRPGQPRRGVAAGSGTSRDRWPSVRGLLFNPRRPLFARAAMRRAVNYALDRRALAPRHRVPAADRPAHAAGLARLPRRDDLPARRARPRHGPAPRGRRPPARRPLHVQRRPFCLEQAEIVRAEPRGDRDRPRDPPVQLRQDVRAA